MYKPARPNYLRTYRLKTHFTQGEVAHLMGFERDTTVSRHELFQRLPSIREALLYERIYSTSVYELFAGELEEGNALLAHQSERLFKKLSEVPTSEGSKQKVAILTRLCDVASATIPLWNEESES